MNLQERLIELSKYNITFNVANGNFVIRIRYDEKWDVIEPENKEVSFYRDENDSLLYYYVAPISINIEEIFHAIDETIDYNIELEEKVVFFKQKMAELQEIFAKEPMEVLKTLEFKTKKKKEKVKKEKSLEKVDDKEETTEVIEEKSSESAEKVEEKEISDIDAKINAVLGE